MEKFNSFSEIVKDPYFIEFTKKNILELIRKRNIRPEPKPGFYYKRDWYDRMSEAGSLTTEFFIKHIEYIWNKKSSLSSEIRHIIEFVCGQSLHQTLMQYSNPVK